MSQSSALQTLGLNMGGCSGQLEPILWLSGKPVREDSKEEESPLLERSAWKGCQTLSVEDTDWGERGHYWCLVSEATHVTLLAELGPLGAPHVLGECRFLVLEGKRKVQVRELFLCGHRNHLDGLSKTSVHL